VIQPFFAWPPVAPRNPKELKPKDSREKESNSSLFRSYQEAVLFFEQRDVKNEIAHQRRVRKINVKEIVSKLDVYQKNAMKKDSKSRKQATEMFSKLRLEVDSKLTKEVLSHMLDLFDRPLSWETTLCYYILTNRIITPAVKCFVYPSVDRVVVEVSADANVDDYKLAYSQVEKFQQFLPGYALKTIRMKPNLEHTLKIVHASKKYTNPYDVIDAVYDTSLKDEKKRRVNIRKTKERYKRLLS
jgi:hypothetical protein